MFTSDVYLNLRITCILVNVERFYVFQLYFEEEKKVAVIVYSICSMLFFMLNIENFNWILCTYTNRKISLYSRRETFGEFL